MMWVACIRCERCGPVEIDANAVMVGPQTDEGVSQLSWRARCPHCGVLMAEAADGMLVCALLSRGARWEEWSWPAELIERGTVLDAPFTEADITQFRSELDRLPTARNAPD